MEFDNTFRVDQPIDAVWRAMLDVERVAPCVPGAQVVERTGDDAYKVAIKVRLGPVSMTYTGNVEIAEADEAAHRAVLRARARETRGQGTADATVELRLAEDGAGTSGTIHSDVAISGRAAAMGQGVIADVSGRLIDTFAANLATMLAGGAAPEPAAAAPAEAAEPAAAAAEPAAAAAEPAAAVEPPPPPSPPADEAGLPVLSIAGAVIAGRLKDPRVLGGALAVALLAGYLLGRGRR